MVVSRHGIVQGPVGFAYWRFPTVHFHIIMLLCIPASLPWALWRWHPQLREPATQERWASPSCAVLLAYPFVPLCPRHLQDMFTSLTS